MSKLTDKLVGVGVKPDLSPNPEGSGYIKQVNVNGYSTSDIVGPQPNVLYILLDGRQLKYVLEPTPHYVRVENGPDYQKVEGERGTPVHENVPPQERPQVFSGPVAFQEEPTIKGKKLGDYIDSQGGVTEQEMEEYVADHKELPTLTGNAGKVLKVSEGASGVEWATDNAGTKLYLHTIENTDGDIIKIISYDDTPITQYSILKQLFDTALIVSGLVISESNGSGMLLSCYNAAIWYFDGDLETISSLDGEAAFNSDTVTPL